MQVGVMGFCIGGHLAYRGSLNKGVQAGACIYPTDIHKGSLGKGMQVGRWYVFLSSSSLSLPLMQTLSQADGQCAAVLWGLMRKTEQCALTRGRA